MLPDNKRTSNLHPDEPGTLGQQLAAVSLALYLAERRGTTTAAVWQDARQLAIPHARSSILPCDPPSSLLDESINP